jgi:hypothetical protein
MRRMLLAATVVVIAGAVAGFLLWPLDGNETASAGPKGRNSPDPVDVSAIGFVPIAEAEFALGMGCDILDLDKVGAVLRRELASQGVSRIYAPPLVHLCEESGNNRWILHTNIQTEPRDPSTLVLPADCTGAQSVQAKQPCPPSFENAGAAAISRAVRNFHVESSGSEVLQ